jgi:DNA-binding SARP family transcriptional activator
VKAKSVLQYLMTRPRESIVRDMLIEALWPDCEAQAAGNNLKAAVHSLRQSLGCLLNRQDSFPFILSIQGQYRMNPEIELWVDVEEFDKRWMTGRHLEREGNISDAVREFEQAEALYGGDYLEDEPYEEWTLLRREALKDTYLIVLGKLAGHCMETGDFESSIIYCQKILAKDPCREDAYRRLMRCYSRLGHRNRALDWYEICRHTIQAEVDTGPIKTTHVVFC